jgi:hypothetical protein
MVMQFALLFNHRDRTRILARLLVLEDDDIDEAEEPAKEEQEPESKVDGGSKTIRTGFQSKL